MIEWMQCSDELPEMSQRVLVWAPDGERHYGTVAERLFDSILSDPTHWKWYGSGDYEDWDPCEITYWAPIIPPKDVANG